MLNVTAVAGVFIFLESRLTKYSLKRQLALFFDASHFVLEVLSNWCRNKFKTQTLTCQQSFIGMTGKEVLFPETSCT